MSRWRVRREVQKQFWVELQKGVSVRVAAASVGVGKSVAYSWVNDAGGVIPTMTASTTRLTFLDREEIAFRRARGDGIRQIARALDRSASTISRELRRGTLQPFRGYRPSTAQQATDRRLARPKRGKFLTSDRLRETVQTWLEDKLSPEQISGRLRVEFPDEPEMRVSHETIYQALYVQGRGLLRAELGTCLRTGRAIRRPRGRAPRESSVRDKVMISDRPPEVEDRSIPGNWEGDLITGTGNKSAIGTLVERATGFVILLHLPHRHGAIEVRDQMIEKIQSLPASLRKSVTWDQGVEMAAHKDITLATGIEIYFCDPHAPWQRGTNENTNGLLRQYFPKGTDLSGYHPDYLDYVAEQLNDRPRKRLGFHTPKEALDKLLSDPQNQPVAPTT